MPHVIPDEPWPDRPQPSDSKPESQYDQYGDGQTWEFGQPEDCKNVGHLQITLLRHAKIRGWNVRSSVSGGRLRFQRLPLLPVVVEMWAPFELYLLLSRTDRMDLESDWGCVQHLSALAAAFAAGDCSAVFPESNRKTALRHLHEVQAHLMQGSDKHVYATPITSAVRCLCSSAKHDQRRDLAMATHVLDSLEFSLTYWLVDACRKCFAAAPNPVVFVPPTDRVLRGPDLGPQGMLVSWYGASRTL